MDRGLILLGMFLSYTSSYPIMSCAHKLISFLGASNLLAHTIGN